MTWSQYRVMEGLLRELADDDPVFTHGDCIGADAEAAALAYALDYQALSQPCDIKKMRANCPALVVLEPLPPLERNKNIVDFCEVLIGCPKEDEEQRRSGTWATIRHARRTWTEHYLIFPNGTIHHQAY